MASIDLSSLIDRIRVPRPGWLDFGGELTPATGGTVQRVNRLGNRYRLGVELAPVPEEPDAREIAALLRLAKQNGAIMTWPQFGLSIGNPGTPLVNGAVSGGTSVAIDGLTAGYVIKFGQMMSFVEGGRRYLHSAAAQSTANGSGAATLVLTEPLRKPLSNNSVVEIATPKIEGLLDSGDLDWAPMMEPYVQFAFTITEPR